MFQRFVSDAKSAASSLVLKYVARASVAIPFLIALGFAIAAVTVMLVQHFGHAIAYWIMAGGLAVIGIIATITVSAREHEDRAAERQAEDSYPAGVVSQVVGQAPLALLGTLVATPGGAASALALARVVVRHLPLVVLGAMIAALFWPRGEEAGSAEARYVKPNGFERGTYTH